MTIDELESRLSECTDDDVCTSLADQLLAALNADKAAIPVYRADVSMPLAASIKVRAFSKLMRYSESTESWLILLAANVILHSQCHIVIKKSIIRQFVLRLEHISDELVEFMLKEIANEDCLNSLVDNIIVTISISGCTKERQLRLIRIVFDALPRITDGRCFLSSIVATAERNEDLYEKALKLDDISLEMKVLLHLGLLKRRGSAYSLTIEDILEMSLASETAKWFAHYYATLH